MPAFDLIYTIVISDAAALMHIKLKNNASLVTDLANLVEDDDESHLFVDVENDCSCWGEFSEQSKLISRECNEWMCVPLLWVDALIAVDPSTFPLALSKALFWSLSRVSLLEPLTSAEMELSLNDWLSSYAKELSCYLAWQVLSGCDDGGDGNWSENSVKASAVSSSLIKTLKRFVAFFLSCLISCDLGFIIHGILNVLFLWVYSSDVLHILLFKWGSLAFGNSGAGNH